MIDPGLDGAGRAEVVDGEPEQDRVRALDLVDELVGQRPRGGLSGRVLGGRDLIVLAARGGGYAPGTPREGWDHAEQWLPHGLSITGLTPRFITAELTLADVTPAMAELKPLAAESLTAAQTAIDALWETDAIAA